MEISEVQTHWAEICLAGDYQDAIRACREYCNDVGLCVTVERCAYVYTGGMEDGVKVRLVNYPRFPSTEEEIVGKAMSLALKLVIGLFQQSAMLVTPYKTIWFNGRDK